MRGCLAEEEEVAPAAEAGSEAEPNVYNAEELGLGGCGTCARISEVAAWSTSTGYELGYTVEILCSSTSIRAWMDGVMPAVLRQHAIARGRRRRGRVGVGRSEEERGGARIRGDTRRRSVEVRS